MITQCSWRAFDDVGESQCNTLGEEADYTACRQNGFSCVDYTYTHVIADHYNALCLLHVKEQNSSLSYTHSSARHIGKMASKASSLSFQGHPWNREFLFLVVTSDLILQILHLSGLLILSERPQYPSSVCLVPLPKHFILFRISIPLLHPPGPPPHQVAGRKRLYEKSLN